ncbi:hypothetical protein [Endozoicomonas ascidiicola]|uniref:hypothetical protein n=1 Tax=Endozoicomonas ascidiicola TaxID=1698521 RepID=UPI000829BC0F|nr:hypothetical protein [Endozoicomonas ascidiicola]
MNTNTSNESLKKLQKNFHSVIMERVGDLINQNAIELPTLEMIAASDDTEAWFPVNGMYGGFKYWIERNDNCEIQLISESWCRVMGGSGQRHHITVEGYELVDEGFV